MVDGTRGPAASSVRAALARRLAIGALVLVAAAWLFGAVAHDVVSGARLTTVDVDASRWLHARATPALTRAMLVWTNVHSTMAIGAYSAVVALALAATRRWRLCALVVVTVGGVLVVNVLMKLAFQRARPTFDDPLLTLATYSFPSGHVAGSTAFYGLAVVWVFARSARPLPRALAVVGALAAIALVAFTRMALGVHYLSDVVGAFAEAIAWLAICLGAFAVFGRTAPRGVVP